uniref:Triple QxxK/R motif-containing protein n=1 Tax=Ornithodoros turicata TaxID=34597 RepID=A0A2R5LBX1_9ACAR
MARARKDSFNSQPPIDSYRKVIGKQDYKKSKSELQESKKKAQAKKSKPKTYKEIGLIIGCLVAMVLASYTLCYFLLSGSIP